MSPKGKDSENDGVGDLWRQVKTNTRLIRFSWWTFIHALPLFILWLLIPFVLLIANSLYQSNSLSSERDDQARKEYLFGFTGGNSENLTLHLSHPQKLRIDPDQPYDDSVAVWLARTLPDTLTLDEGKISETYTFSLTFERDVADFVNEKGEPAPGLVKLSPALDKDTAKVLYLKSNPVSLVNGGDITIIVDQAPSIGNTKEISIPVEAPSESRLRHFLDAVFSLPILIGGLLTAIAGFGMQQWKVLNDEEQRYKVGQEEATHTRLQEFLKKENYQHAFEIYQEHIREVETPNPRIKGLFDDYILPQKVKEEIKGELDKPDFQKAIGLYLEYSKANVVGLENIWNDAILQKLIDLLTTNDSGSQDLYNLLDKRSALTSRIKKLWSFRENYYFFTGKMPNVSKLRQLLRPWPEIIVYERLPGIQERADIKRGMDFLGISQNPFGSEKAEDDFLFANKVDFVDKDANDVFPMGTEIRFDQSQLIVGLQGAGKTALALFLAGQSFSKPEKIFPIYSKLFPLDTAEVFLRHITEVLLNYYAKNPAEFLAQDTARQSALAVLLSNYLASGDDLSFRLQLTGLTDEPSSADFQRRLMDLTHSAQIIKLIPKGGARLLLQACPLEYKSFLFLFDCQSIPFRVSDGGEIVDLIKELQYGRGVVIKVISARSEFSNAVTDRLQLPIVDIDWSFDQLKEVLRVRMKESNVSGLGFWFDVGIRSFSQELLIKSSGGTPGGLIRKGNEILRVIGRNKRTLNLKDANQIFGSAIVKKVLKES